MKNRKKKNAITLLALVITIVIMLLLAGIAIQMTMGENGLIAKSVQAQKEQAKAELYDTAKLSYMSLNAKALENGQPSPQAELALSTTEFRDKYNIVGDDITDKKGTVIDTKLNVLNVIQGTVAGGFTPGTTSGGSTPTPASWPKTVAGVTIPEEDKDKMVLKVKVPGNTGTLIFQGNAITIDYGNYGGVQETNVYIGKQLKYNQGEYILKVSNYSDFEIKISTEENTEVEILQWGKPDYTRIDEYSTIIMDNISKIYEPEPDNIPIWYQGGSFIEIPEWLFSKKVTSKKMSCFIDCEKITSIPENLFKDCINIEEFHSTFRGCTRLTSIPENLFKYNTKVKNMISMFENCKGLTSISKNLFKYNTNITSFNSMFTNCTGLTSIPEELFKYNTDISDFSIVFAGCTGLTSISESLLKYNVKMENVSALFERCIGLTSVPEELFKYNTELKNFSSVFDRCTGLTSIPENLFKHNINAKDFYCVFRGCTGLTSIPENLFKHNTKLESFSRAFQNCTGLTSIPEELFKYNKIIENVWESFEGCSNITYIPDNIIEVVKKVKEKHGDIRQVFKGCTSASNYSSIPEYMIK